MSNAKTFDTYIATLAMLVAAPIFAHYSGSDWRLGVAVSLWISASTLGIVAVNLEIEARRVTHRQRAAKNSDD